MKNCFVILNGVKNPMSGARAPWPGFPITSGQVIIRYIQIPMPKNFESQREQSAGTEFTEKCFGPDLDFSPAINFNSRETLSPVCDLLLRLGQSSMHSVTHVWVDPGMKYFGRDCQKIRGFEVGRELARALSIRDASKLAAYNNRRETLRTTYSRS